MDVLTLARALVCLFFAVLFLQSGFDKVWDWSGNLRFLDEHFGKTPLHQFTMLLMAVMTVTEVATGLISSAAVIAVLLHGGEAVPALAMTMACLALIMLFFGQRVSKDYAGAVSLATYFGVALFGLLLQWPAIEQVPVLVKKMYDMG